eukprot:IDg12242t1
MDTKGFVNWIHWWYEEAKKVSNGQWYSLMYNCEGHNSISDLDGVTIVLLQENTTGVYKPLDKGLFIDEEDTVLHITGAQDYRHSTSGASKKDRFHMLGTLLLWWILHGKGMVLAIVDDG